MHDVSRESKINFSRQDHQSNFTAFVLSCFAQNYLVSATNGDKCLNSPNAHVSVSTAPQRWLPRTEWEHNKAHEVDTYGCCEESICDAVMAKFQFIFVMPQDSLW